jgi:hypothetical protein
VIVVNERHLKRLMIEYIRYYHEDRTHLALAKGTPASRDAEKNPRLGTYLYQDLAVCIIAMIWPPKRGENELREDRLPIFRVRRCTFLFTICCRCTPLSSRGPLSKLPPIETSAPYWYRD